jgi:hypothetical protein
MTTVWLLVSRSPAHPLSATSRAWSIGSAALLGVMCALTAAGNLSVAN